MLYSKQRIMTIVERQCKMAISGASGDAANQDSNPTQDVSTFRHAVIEHFSLQLGGRSYA